MIKKILFSTLCLMTSLGYIAPTMAIVVEIPTQQGQEDIAVTGSATIKGDEDTIFATIQRINSYLWFAVALVCMGVLIWGGFLLITAQGDEAKMKQSNKLLVGALVGILIAILSYAIIRLLVNLL